MNKSPLLIGCIQTSRLGQVWVALSEHGLVTVEFGVSRAKFEAAVRKQTRCDVEYVFNAKDFPSLARATRQIKEYMDGKRRSFDLKIDWSVLSSDFQRAALRAVFSIPYGQTRTYAQVAAQIGRPAGAPRSGPRKCNQSDAPCYPLSPGYRLRWQAPWLWWRRRPQDQGLAIKTGKLLAARGCPKAAPDLSLV